MSIRTLIRRSNPLTSACLVSPARTRASCAAFTSQPQSTVSRIRGFHSLRPLRTEDPGSHYVDASQLQFGQPLHETHPHLIQAGELTPGISAQEYHDRRAALCERLPKGSVVLLESADVKWASPSVFYPHRQDNNFLYLTGFQEDNAVAVIEKLSDNPEDFAFHLFVHAKDPANEQWAGPRSGTVAARDVFNADSAYDITELSLRLPLFLKHAFRVYADVRKPMPGHGGSQLWELLRDGSCTESSTLARGKTQRLSPHTDELRMTKSPAEIANMRRAGAVAGRAITNLMRREWALEKDVATTLEYEVKSGGCTGLSFIPVVASGRNTSCVHYVHNNGAIAPGSLILVDAGGEYGNYVSDITRVWPQHGEFNPAQRDLYEALLTAQRHCVSLCRESAGLSLNDIHREARARLASELGRLGFDSPLAHIDRLFNHHVGHYIGLDVHDCAGVSRSVPLRAGNCVTIEPGVYVPHDDQYPRHFRGLGMRIEDSIAVDTDSVINLTVEAVKEVADIEALRR